MSEERGEDPVPGAIATMRRGPEAVCGWGVWEVPVRCRRCRQIGREEVRLGNSGAMHSHQVPGTDTR